MRGFSMLMVVVVHVLGSCGVGGQQTVFGAFICSFFLNLFFFLSGFVTWKPIKNWTKEKIKSALMQRFKAQIICAIVFFAILRYVQGGNPLGWIDNGFGAYWFTTALFQMFLLYLVAVGVGRLIGKDISCYLIVSIAIVSLGLIACHLVPSNRIVSMLNVVNICWFLPYYALGIVARRFEDKFLRLMDHQGFRALLIVSFCFLFAISFNHHDAMPESVAKFMDVIKQFTGVSLIFMLFYSAKKYFDNEHWGAKFLRLVGRRTLDIYMIHYFFLPQLPMVGAFIEPSNMVLFQVVIVGGLAVMITLMSLLVSNCLRTSSVLADWLFGARPVKKLCR